ncbi:MAG: hypothetical protein ACI8UO_002597 [Verrucomicrobiales bacterium]|jgi:hypothetical protein
MSKATIVSAPGAEEREVWQRSGRSAKLAKSGNPAVGCYCFATRDLTCIPLWINSTDPELTSDLVQMELEKRRLILEGPGVSYDYRVVDKQGPRSQVEITVVPPETQLEEQDLNWASFNASARIFDLPENQITLWKEEKQWVAAFTKGKELAYYHPLGVAELDEDVVSELQVLFLTLQQKEHADILNGVTVWEVLDPIAFEQLEQAFGVDVKCESRPKPDFRRLRESSLKPHEVARDRAEAATRNRFTLAAVIVGIVYVGLLLGAIIHLKSLDSSNHETSQRIQAVAPEADIVRNVLDRWESLRPAVDPTRYPLDLFHRCASILPERGVRITHFEVNGDRLIIRGEATNPALAISYQNELIALEELSDYKWEASPTTIDQVDYRARFQAVGVYRYGQTES